MYQTSINIDNQKRSQLQRRGGVLGTSISRWGNTFKWNCWDVEATEEQSGAQLGKIEILCDYLKPRTIVKG